MKLSEVLTQERILLPMEAGGLRSAVGALVSALVDTGALREGLADRLVADIVDGDAGELIRVNEAFLLGAAQTDAADSLVGALGVAPTPFRVDAGEWESTLARGVVLLLTPQRLSNLRVQAIPTVVRFFREGEHSRAVLQAEGPEEVLGLDALDEVEIHDQLLVDDALTPLQYRVYPETPMEEVVDLMIRRELRAVPVVGENHEVLGILTSGDALKHLLPQRMGGESKEAGPARARDVMTRSVLCVSEDQPLVEAANTMVNKDVAQLPVVREGELIGFLTRRTLLRQLFGR